MTAVTTTPPPRLPVRDKAEARDRAWGGVSPMLTRLAAERATGVLVRERGTLHLAEGRVVHAESPEAPGLGELLTARGTLDADTWHQAVAQAQGVTGAALLLAERNLLTRGELELSHLEALYDAAYFALSPSSSPGRFRYVGAEEAPGVHPVAVAALEHETLRRRDLLHRVWPDPASDHAPLHRASSLGAPSLTARQRAVLDRVDGVRAAPDIARAIGRPAFHTLVDVRRLAAAGLVTCGAPRPVTPPQSTDPDITLLKRLRDALESL
ncbi:transcriptional regulator [Streptomyces sp. NPDC090106]|uniref:transcriptional regulator n=1 Tax=Streptomyces sp. NPDC090106 TaxID=3365946 RepID=UPI00380C9F42